jgi:hypothetical protein
MGTPLIEFLPSMEKVKIADRVLLGNIVGGLGHLDVLELLLEIHLLRRRMDPLVDYLEFLGDFLRKIVVGVRLEDLDPGIVLERIAAAAVGIVD